MRRIYLILGVSLVAIGIASYLAWALVRPAPPSVSDAPPPNLFARLFPFGGGVGGEGGGPQAGQGDGEGAAPRAAPQLRKVSEKPVAGGMAFATSTGVVIRFIERETGHVYETPAESLAVVRVSNTTIPRIERVVWISADEFVASYLGDAGALQNFYAKLAPGKMEQSLNGTFIESFARGALDPSGSSLLSVTEIESGARFSVSRPDGSGARSLVTSPLKSWIPLQSSKSFYAATAPSSGVLGYLYAIVNGGLRRVIGDIPGMLALPSSSGRYVAVSSGLSDDFALGVYDTTKDILYDIPLKTLAPKCAWVSESPAALVCGVPTLAPAGDYPNDWLLGKVEFSDALWGIEPESGTTVYLADLAGAAGAPVDVSQPSVTGSYLTFLNKRDLSFWSFRFLEGGITTPAE